MLAKKLIENESTEENQRDLLAMAQQLYPEIL
jgi:hypothetical protein